MAGQHQGQDVRLSPAPHSFCDCCVTVSVRRYLRWSQEVKETDGFSLGGCEMIIDSLIDLQKTTLKIIIVISCHFVLANVTKIGGFSDYNFTCKCCKYCQPFEAFWLFLV